MAKINFRDTKIQGLKIVEPFVAADNRGYFMKAFEASIFAEAGIDTSVSETFESFSKHNVVRGMHFQLGDTAQAKLVRVLSGEVYDVCVDIRPDSLTFGQWVGEYLSAENHKAFYLEKGLAHGFLVTSENALMSYTCTGAHSATGESGIRWNDPDLAITWPVDDAAEIIISDRDAALQSFREYRLGTGR